MQKIRLCNHKWFISSVSWNYTKHANVFLYFFLDLLLVREVLFNKSCMFNSHTCYDGHNMHFKLEPFWYLHPASLSSKIRWVLAFSTLPWLLFRFRLLLVSGFPDFPYAQNKFGGKSTGRFECTCCFFVSACVFLAKLFCAAPFSSNGAPRDSKEKYHLTHKQFRTRKLFRHCL